MRRAAFLDRDGVINIDHGYVHKPDDFEWIPGVLEAAARLSNAGFALVVVTNQSGIGRGYYDESEFTELTRWMSSVFAKAGAPLAGVYFCPHHPVKARGKYQVVCHCRKPAPGMLLRAAQELSLDLSRSAMFGDKSSDCQAGLAAGCPERIFLSNNFDKLPAEATRGFQNLYEAVFSPWFEQFAKTPL